MKQIIYLALAIVVGMASFNFALSLPLEEPIRIWLKYTKPQLVHLKQEALSGEIQDYFVTNLFLHRVILDSIDNMSPEERVGELLMPAWEKNETREEFIDRVKTYHVGGVMVLRNDVSRRDVAVLKQELSKDINGTLIEPLISIDAEPSLMQYRLPSEAYATTTDELTSETLAFAAGEEIGTILNEYGYNLNFAPVYDSGFNTSIIGNRAFGTTAEEIVPRANSFARGLLGQNIIPIAKHFPGHGHVEGDTHKTLQSVPGSVPEKNVFAQAIDYKIPMIMIGHLAIDGGAFGTYGVPATLSATTSSLLLRESLDFQGVAITDAMTMGALEGYTNADQRALEAGVDILLMPRDIQSIYQKLTQGEYTNKLTQEDIHEKLYRIMRLKLVTQWSS